MGLRQDLYGLTTAIFNCPQTAESELENIEIIEPPPIWKEVVWLKQLSWSRKRKMNKETITLNAEDISSMLGTTLKMVCVQCKQKEALCRAVGICDCFFGSFTASDLYL